jgi:hypothetical protein
MAKNLESEEDQQGNGEIDGVWRAAGNPALRDWRQGQHAQSVAAEGTRSVWLVASFHDSWSLRDRGRSESAR